MEDFSTEIMDCITETYKDDNELIVGMLMYLYKGCNFDERMKPLRHKIINWFEDNDYCLECGSKFDVITYEEHHTELFGNPIEYVKELVCPICDDI